mmetsp:Transcript_9163/g.30173  ORF Transcript_9163/g.30173 Transcript_9163/m.30173 type:complete len:222 (+) Transcript_9163:2551-3216(+)
MAVTSGDSSDALPSSPAAAPGVSTISAMRSIVAIHESRSVVSASPCARPARRPAPSTAAAAADDMPASPPARASARVRTTASSFVVHAERGPTQGPSGPSTRLKPRPSAVPATALSASPAAKPTPASESPSACANGPRAPLASICGTPSGSAARRPSKRQLSLRATADAAPKPSAANGSSPGRCSAPLAVAIVDESAEATAASSRLPAAALCITSTSSRGG